MFTTMTKPRQHTAARHKPVSQQLPVSSPVGARLSHVPRQLPTEPPGTAAAHNANTLLPRRSPGVVACTPTRLTPAPVAFHATRGTP